MDEIGCTTCHMPDLPLETDRRVADVETVYDPARGIFNSLFAGRPCLPRARTTRRSRPCSRPCGPFRSAIFSRTSSGTIWGRFHERNFNGTITTQF